MSVRFFLPLRPRPLHPRLLRAGLSPAIRLALLLLLCAPWLRAQVLPTPDPYSTVKDYVIVFPDTVKNRIDPRFPNQMQDMLSLFFYSADSNQVRITGPGFDSTVTSLPRRFAAINIQDNSRFTPNSVMDVVGRVSTGTFRVTSKKPIVLYCYMMTAFGGEMWTPIPVERWGKEYYVAALPGEVVIDMTQNRQLNFVQVRSRGPAQATIIAAYDRTTVTIHPTYAMASDPYTLTLNANEAYTIQSLVDTVASPGAPRPQIDISGVRIVADRPIAVISGNTRAQVLPELATSTGNSIKNLQAEWLPSVEQLGTEFVYLPTWDSRRLTGAPIEKPAEKRQYEIVRAYSGSQTPSKIYYRVDSTRVDTATLNAAGVREYRIAATKAHYIRTEKPSQMMMHSAAVVKNNGAVGGIGSTSYDSWGAYMVEMIPREQWSTFAPYFVPPYPFETEHYIAVVADTHALDMIYFRDGMPFEFNHGVIPGTDLMWGTMRVSGGDTNYLEGRRGTRFSAYAYGVRAGMEFYRARSSRGSGEYREIIGLSYGYPLAPRRRLLRPGDSLRIDTSWSACTMSLRIATLNAEPVGLYSAMLEPGGSNATLSTVLPAGPAGVIGATTAELSISVNDPQQDASGVVQITDRTGKVWRVPFSYEAERLDADEQFDFGGINVGTTGDSVMVMRNTSGRELCVRRIGMGNGLQGLSIVRSEPSGPELDPPTTVTLPPGGELRIWMQATPKQGGKIYRDSLRVALCCSEQRVEVVVGAAVPCLEIKDLDFGVLEPNQIRTLELELCNRGGGVVSFGGDTAAAVMSWLEDNFHVESRWLDSLRKVRLGAGKCVRIPVKFMAEESDTFVTVARVFANTRDCRDTSIWRAVVREPFVSGVDRELLSGSVLEAIQPNPTSGRAEIRFRLATAMHARLAIYNTAGEMVEEIVNRPMAAGPHEVSWDASELPAGIYYCRLTSGYWSAAQSIVVRR